MGLTERKQREREALRAKILEAARALFTEFGYEAVTMRRVAEKIEYSPTAIYLHFADKAALVQELCSRDFQALGARFQALAREPEPLVRLRGIGLAYVHFAREHPNQYRMMFMTPTPPVPIEARQIEKGNPQVDAWAFLVGTVASAQQSGLLRRDLGGPETLAQLFFSGVHGVASLHIAKANDPWIPWQPLDHMAEQMLDALLRAYAEVDKGSVP